MMRYALVALTVLASGVATHLSAQSADHATAAAKRTIVLVHGAWADASGWYDVTVALQARGYKVVAVQNSLFSFAKDIETTRRVLDAQQGPLVVVGHSYGGAVITNAAAGNQNVKALVYIDASFPGGGESTLKLGGGGSLLATAVEYRKFPPFGENDIDVYLKRDMFREA